MTSLWRNFSGNVVANSNWIITRTGENMGQFSTGPINIAVLNFRNSLTRVRSLISASRVHWRMQLTAARWSGRFNKMHETLARIAHVIVSQQCLHKNCPQMIAKKQWPPNNSSDLNVIEISCLGSDAQSYFGTFVWSPKQFLN